MPEARDRNFEPVIGADGKVDFVVGLATLALWANRSDETVLKAKRAGVIEPVKPGRYRLRECLVRMDEHRSAEERRASKSASASRVQDVRAEEIAQRIRGRDRVHETEAEAAAVTVVDEVVGPLRTDVYAIPARVTKDLGLRHRIESELDAAFTAAADRLDAHRGGEEAGVGASAPDAADAPRRVGSREPRVPPQRRRSRAA